MKTLITLSLALAAASVAAQQNQPQQHQQRFTTISGGLEIGIPIGEFDATWGHQMVGLSANMVIPMRRLPLSYGFDFGWSRMGSKREVVAIDEENIQATTGDLKVTSNVYAYHGLLRLQPITGKVSPYVEAMGGMRQFTTRSRIDVEGMDQPPMEQRNENEFIGSIGWAAGVQVLPGKNRNLLLELRLERLNGGQVNYVDPRSIVITPDGVVDYSTLSSGTRVVNLTFGVGLRF
ncbi:MAG: hypothetical protein IPP83_16770 [Flavobacteriales bacterium]|nr:hypothetical protein [Flavobacteriales bacterium]